MMPTPSALPPTDASCVAGAGESGKTTIIKQMKILHVRGFSEEERREKADEIRRNIIESIRVNVASCSLSLDQSFRGQDITAHMSRLDPPVSLQVEGNERFLRVIQAARLDESQLTDEVFDAAEQLWADPGVRESYRRSNEYPLIDCAK